MKYVLGFPWIGSVYNAIIAEDSAAPPFKSLKKITRLGYFDLLVSQILFIYLKYNSMMLDSHSSGKIHTESKTTLQTKQVSILNWQ